MLLLLLLPALLHPRTALAQTNTAPIALHMVVPAAANSEHVVRLRGYDADGNNLKVSLVTLPQPSAATAGSLHQLSQPYSAYGYEPKRGNPISAEGTVVTGSANRLVYSPPRNRKAPADRWGFFRYQVEDTSFVKSAKPGLVALLAPGNVLVASSFTFGTEGWTVASNGAGGVGAFHSASSRGALNHYLHSRDDEINVVSGTGDDARLWYFQAPAATYHSSTTSNPTNLFAYGGALEFTLSSQAGDFSANNLNRNLSLVVIECATCDSGMGVRLMRRMDDPDHPLTFNGQEKRFSIPFTANVWFKDSKSTIQPHTRPTDCELIEVLNGLSSLRILGDFTRWHESVSMDDVQLTASPNFAIPLSCYPVG